jgi:ABC-type multidrug transport system ATPase subunit
VYDDLTALENLRFWAALSSLPADTPRLLGALVTVELDRFADERARTFSVGMRRRLSLARIVLTRPSVLLLDEPFAGLDQRAGKWLEGYLQQFKTDGGAVLMTTHTFSRGLSVMDRAAILAGGRIALDTTLDGLSPDDVRKLYDLHAEEGS